MPLPDLTEADRAILAQVIRERIAADRFPLSPRGPQPQFAPEYWGEAPLYVGGL
jgi:hypothetical protein